MSFLSFKSFLAIIYISFLSTTVLAGVCDLSGSGIGGTGATTGFNNGSRMGGTGDKTNKTNGSGLGGTGKPLSKTNGSGIGGTGQKQDSQSAVIIGTITGFGSICVNGIEIHYTDSTPVQLNGEDSAAGQLAIGQIVSVTVNGVGAEVNAEEIEINNIVSGPITAIDQQLNQLTVLGQTVRLLDHTLFSDGSGSKPVFEKGHFINVSGFRQTNGEILANRIDQSSVNNTVNLTGPVENISSRGFMIAGALIESEQSTDIQEGEEVNVKAFLQDDKIIAQHIKTPGVNINQHFNIEGLPKFEQKKEGGIDIKLGQIKLESHQVNKQILESLKPNQRLIIAGQIKADQQVKINHIFIKQNITRDENKQFDHFSNKKAIKYFEKEKSKELQNQAISEKKAVDKEPFKSKPIQNKAFDNQKIEKRRHSIPLHKLLPLEQLQSNRFEKNKVEIPEFKIPKIKKTEIDESETETARIAPPEVETAEVEITEIETPEIEVPEIETPEIEVPEIETPEIEVPEIETPEIEVPEIETPEIEVPEIETPEIEVPEIETPEIEVPEIETPEIEVPEIETPEIEVPEIETPEIEVPEIETPEIEVPEIETPEIEVPEIETPDIEDD